MISHFQIALDYIIYFFSASSKYDIHSPFVYKFTTDVLNIRKQKPIYHEIELIRSKMLKSNVLIEVEPFGATKNLSTQYLPLKKVTQRTSKSAKYCELLERICQYFNPEVAIEIGTSVGVSTMYQAAGIKQGVLYTLEGNKNSLQIAQHNCEKLGYENVSFLQGNFEDTLPKLINELEKVDYVFFDGNHQLEHTLKYFEICLQKAHTQSVFIFDDINWSTEMNQAWNKIKNHPSVYVTIDIFFMGIVFFNSYQAKEHFTIRY